MRLKVREEQEILLPALAESLLLSGLVAYLFYDSCFGLFTFPVLFAGRWRVLKKRQAQKRYRSRRREFQEVLSCVASGLYAGNSLEQALEKSSEKPWGKETAGELFRIRGALINRRLPEELFAEWGMRWQMEEITEFGGILRLAKRYGGNLPKLIRQFTKNIYEMEAVDLEISTMVAAKRFEGKIMLAVPFVILWYMRASGLSVVEWLYSGLAGRIFMTVGLFVELLASVLIEKIVRIEV